MTDNIIPNEQANPVVKSISQDDIQRAVDLSVQTHPAPDETTAGYIPYGSLFFALSKSLPPWWSPARDVALDAFWRQVNILAGAVYAITSKLTTIPFRVTARDITIQAHVDLAAQLTEQFRLTADYGDGWINFFSKQAESLTTLDNGAFFEIIGYGDKDGPIRGIPYSVAHLDSLRCQRTGNPLYPVIYYPVNGQPHKFHFSRVAFTSLQPSAREEMFGVGLSCVSRATSYAQQMLDMSTYKEEKFGSRPPRSIVLAGGGLDGEKVGRSIELVQNLSALKGNTKYVPNIIIGSPDIPDPKLTITNLASLPEGFDEREATNIAVNAIALAFGVDSREFWPASEGGVTRADAMLSHMKSRGKGPGQILASYKGLFERKVLPHYLQLDFDYQDDSEDRQIAEIRNVRAMTNERISRAKMGTTRLIHQNMLRDGDITDAQYEELELAEGRLVSGEDILTMFYSSDPTTQSLLTMGVENPTDPFLHTAEEMLPLIEAQRTEILKVLANTRSTYQEKLYKQCLAALSALQRIYQPVPVDTTDETIPTSREDYEWDANRPNRTERSELREGMEIDLSPNTLEPRG